MEQEKIIRFQMLEEEINKFNQQFNLIENNLYDIVKIKEGLNEIEKKETKEILVDLGKRIYVPVEIKDKNLIIEVGNKKFVKKTINETIGLIDQQIINLNSAKKEILDKLEELNKEINELISEINKNQS